MLHLQNQISPRTTHLIQASCHFKTSSFSSQWWDQTSNSGKPWAALSSWRTEPYWRQRQRTRKVSSMPRLPTLTLKNGCLTSISQSDATEPTTSWEQEMAWVSTTSNTSTMTRAQWATSMATEMISMVMVFSSTRSSHNLIVERKPNLSTSQDLQMRTNWWKHCEKRNGKNETHWVSVPI